MFHNVENIQVNRVKDFDLSKDCMAKGRYLRDLTKYAENVLARLSTEVNRICHKFQPSFGGANWREPEGWSCIPL